VVNIDTPPPEEKLNCSRHVLGFIIVLICADVKKKLVHPRELCCNNMESPNMRTLCTALAFLVILLAVMPAVKRSLYAVPKPPQAEKAEGES
jgi:hypothetical protein